MKVMRRVGKDIIVYQDDRYGSRKVRKDRAMDRLGWLIISVAVPTLLIAGPKALELYQKVFYLK